MFNPSVVGGGVRGVMFECALRFCACDHSSGVCLIIMEIYVILVTTYS